MAISAILVVLAMICVLPSDAVEYINFPDDWKDCLREVRDRLPIDVEAGSWPVTTCLDRYLYQHSYGTWHKTQTPEYQKFKEEFSFVDTTAKATTPTLRVRKEIRMLTKKEWKNFVKAMNSIWETGEYQDIVDYHSDNDAVLAAHGGPAFFGWHRIYLMRLEDKLREYQPDVTIPFWDWRLEASLYDENLGPEWSKLWNNKYLGYGDGIVTTGRFSHWGIRRNFGDGGLPNAERVQRLFNAKKMADISVPDSISQSGNAEYAHNSGHMWVGGDMASLPNAPRDPVFFLHHCFVDYLWERLRQHFHVTYDVNPDEDYPDVTNVSAWRQPYHEKNAFMPGFGNITNLDGYSSRWTREVYTYEESPRDKDCSECSSNDVRRRCVDICGENLKCKNGKCVPKLLIPTFFEKFGFEGPSTSRVRRETATQDSGTCSDGVCSNAEPTIQNDYKCNGENDIDIWKFVSIKILYRRPQGTKYNTYARHENTYDTTRDIFDPAWYPELKDELATGKPGVYEHCTHQSVQSYVVVRSDSFSAVSSPQFERCPMSGKYAFDEEYAYLPVPNPNKAPVNVSFIAYDQCGRLCTPYCRQVGGEFKKCTGLVHLDGSYDGYGSNPSQVIHDQLEVGEGLFRLRNNKIFLVFDCNAAMEFYFNSYL